MSLYSSSWHAVAQLRPRLAPRVRVHRRRFRGRLWFLLQDPLTERFHRLTPQAWALLAAMDGRRSVAEIWDEACVALGGKLPGQEELVRLLSQLHQQDLLQADVTPEVAELLQRYRRQRWQRWRQRFFNPLSLKWPLFNPDPLLTRLAPRLRFLFDWRGGLLFVATLLVAGMLAATHWRELTEGMADRVLSAQNLLILWLVYPLVKALHELGHGLATRVWGGEVRELGLMFVLFAPVPYVDASASWAFDARRRRIMVAAAGILTELWLAALAMLVWAAAEPGLLRGIAFNVMLIGAVSTLLVNGNPLMRFDGYFILADLIDMPNLAQRGQRYWQYLCDRYLFRAPGLIAPVESPAERRWLLAYAPLSWIYRIFISVQLALFIAGEYFFIGVAIGIWLMLVLLALPLWRAWRHVAHGPTLLRVRQRALRIAGGLAAAVLLLVGLLPLPRYSVAEGVIWMPERSLLRAGQDGFVEAVLAAPGTSVAEGESVALLGNGGLTAEWHAAQAAWDEAQAVHRQALERDPLSLALATQRLEQARHQRHIAGERLAALRIVAHAEGRFVYGHRDDLPGRHVRRGELIGYVDAPGLRPVVRMVVDQDDIELVRRHAGRIEVRLAPALETVYPARLLREVPAAQHALPAAALGHEGGGAIATDPRQGQETRDTPQALRRHFQFDLELPAAADLRWLGARAHVRIDHGSAPLAAQLWLRLRQVFLKHFHV